MYTITAERLDGWCAWKYTFAREVDGVTDVYSKYTHVVTDVYRADHPDWWGEMCKMYEAAMFGSDN